MRNYDHYEYYMDIGETGHAQIGNSSTQDVDEFMRSSVEFSLTLSERSIHSSSSYVGLYCGKRARRSAPLLSPELLPRASSGGQATYVIGIPLVKIWGEASQEVFFLTAEGW